MDLSAVIAAAEHAAEHVEHKSEVPFIVAGSLWALFAVLVSVYGFRRPDFPTGAVAARGVMAVGVLLTLSAVGTAVYVAL